jgi:hypothetical protein
MATVNDVLRSRADAYAWTFDPDRVRVQPRTQLSPRSSAAKHATQVREDRQAADKAHNEVLNQLQAERKRRKAERAKTTGLTTAEILAARRLGTG